MKGEGRVSPDPEVDVYARLSRMGGGRYGLDLWLEHGSRHWHVEQDLPAMAVTYLTRVVRDTYYQPYPEALREVAESLWEAFVPDDLPDVVAEHRARRREHARHRLGADMNDEKVSDSAGARVRIELRDRTLHFLPWEYLPVRAGLPWAGAGYPARFEPPDSDLGALHAALPLRVLFVAASPSRSKMAIDVSAEYDRMAQALEEMGAGRIEVVPLLDPDRDALAAALSASWFHILHIACHGMLAASGPLLALQSRQRSQFLAPAELGALARAGGVRLLTLQTPVSATNYQIAAFAGFAAQARTLGVPGLLFDLRQDTQRIPSAARVYAGVAQGVALDVACREADRASEDAFPVLGLSLYTRYARLFRLEPSEGILSPELLRGASTALYNLVGDAKSEEHHRFVEMVESGASENEVAAMLAWHVKAGASRPEALSGGAAEQIGKLVAHQVVKQPQQLVKGLDVGSLQQVAQAESQQALQELDYVSGNLAQLEQMRATYKATPGWLEAELRAQRQRLGKLQDELKGEG